MMNEHNDYEWYISSIQYEFYVYYVSVQQSLRGV